MSNQLTLDGGTTTDEFEKYLLKIARVYGLENVVFGCSFGDDSVMLTDKAVEMFGSDICVIFENTHIQFGETYKYGSKMREYWGLTNYHETQPDENFIDITNRIGLHGIAKNKMICCSGLKNEPLAKWMKANKKKCTITGLRRSEARRNNCYSMINHHEKRDIWYASPMLYLTDYDVQDYYDSTGIPKHPLYLEPYFADRTGCAPCPMTLKLQCYGKHNSYYDWLKEHFPRWYKFAWICQKRFYEKKCSGGGDMRGYGTHIYRHEWEWPFPTIEQKEIPDGGK
ncbi:MAG: phosphoadenosine phosphosulfate reductase family protein [Candidatus Thorarchaeota archaeon]